MAKKTPAAVLDVFLDKIATSLKQVICSAEPTSFTEANTTVKLGEVAVASGDFTKSTVNTADRKLTVAQKTGATISASGTATHVALLNTDTSELLYVTTITTQAVTSGNTATINSWGITLPQPT